MPCEVRVEPETDAGMRGGCEGMVCEAEEVRKEKNRLIALGGRNDEVEVGSSPTGIVAARTGGRNSLARDSNFGSGSESGWLSCNGSSSGAEAVSCVQSRATGAENRRRGVEGRVSSGMVMVGGFDSKKEERQNPRGAVEGSK